MIIPNYWYLETDKSPLHISGIVSELGTWTGCYSMKNNFSPYISFTIFCGMVIVGYLIPDSDLDLTPDPDQFGALPPVGYINL